MTELRPIDVMAELTETLVEMVGMACAVDGGLNSMANRTHADALRLLARLGLVEIDVDRGRIVTGRWTQREEPKR